MAANGRNLTFLGCGKVDFCFPLARKKPGIYLRPLGNGHYKFVIVSLLELKRLIDGRFTSETAVWRFQK
jgi:hypothetical protein